MRCRKDGLNHRKISMDEYRWNMMGSLCESYPFTEALDIVYGTKDNRVKEYLGQGLSLPEVLSMTFQDEYSGLISYFLSFLPLQKAIQVTVNVVSFRRGLVKNLFAQITYPLCMMAFSLLVLSVFSFYLMPSVISMLDVSASNGIITFLQTVTLGVWMLLALLSVFVMILGGMYRKNDFVRMEKLLGIIGLHTVAGKIVSYVFVDSYRQLLVQGISTKHSVEVLKQYTANKWIPYLAREVDRNLLSGTELSSAIRVPMMDELFVQMLNMGIAAGNVQTVCEQYEIITRQWIGKYCSRLAMRISIAAYSSIGIMVILVYQMLLLPLQLLEEL